VIELVGSDLTASALARLDAIALRRVVVLLGIRVRVRLLIGGLKDRDDAAVGTKELVGAAFTVLDGLGDHACSETCANVFDELAAGRVRRSVGRTNANGGQFLVLLALTKGLARNGRGELAVGAALAPVGHCGRGDAVHLDDDGGEEVVHGEGYADAGCQRPLGEHGREVKFDVKVD